MSGSGGFYKYRCKYFYTHNCPHWVWVNNAACAHCLAEGREEEHHHHHRRMRQHWATPRDIFVPSLRDGVLQYTMMELVAPTEPGEKLWTLRDKTTQPPPTMPVTSAMPNQSSFAATRFDIAKTKGDNF